MTKRKTAKKKPRISSTADIWRQTPELIQRFLSQQPEYEELCNEIAYILKRRITKQGIQVAAVPRRVKSLKSFLEKIIRKKYDDPLSELTDFAGVRVVCLYISDLPIIESIISEEFEVVERVDKLRGHGTDRFGYGAIHFIVKLGGRTFDSRYDNLRDLLCEIQVRTVLQDAWAIIDHHLIYKHESDVPPQLIRKLNSLAGLLESADHLFEQVRQDRNAYISKVRGQQGDAQQFLINNLNLDSFREYLKWKFKDLQLSSYSGQLQRLFENIDKTKYKTLADIDAVINKSADKAVLINREQVLDAPDFYPVHDSAANQVALALFIADESFRQTNPVPSWRIALAQLENRETVSK